MKHFTVEDFTFSVFGIENKLYPEHLLRINNLCEKILDPAQELCKHKITILSGFRSPADNAKHGGSIVSPHLLGEAADITCKDNLELFNILKQLPFDTLVWELGEATPKYIHVSFNEYARGRCMRSYMKNGYKMYQDIDKVETTKIKYLFNNFLIKPFNPFVVLQ